MALKNEPQSVTKIIIFIILFTSTASCLNPDVQNKIDKIVNEDFLPSNHIPGLGLSIVSEHGESVWAKGYGKRDLENSINSTADTQFCIGSISKSFTATLVVKTLSELYPDKSASVLDIPIRKLHPASNFMLRDRYRSESTTFRDILAQKTCLSSEVWGIIIAGSFKDVDEFVFRQRFAPEVCPFRTRFVYNNAIVAQAGEIIATIVNSTLEDMFPKLFEEIGMSSTTFVRRSDDYDEMPNMSRAYYRKDAQTQQFNRELLKKVFIAPGSGGIISTPNDMAKYLLFHLNKGKVGSKQIVSKEAMGWLVESANPNRLPIAFKTHKDDIVSDDYAYGLGLYLGIYDGWLRISHSGYLPPFHSYMTFYPALKIGVFTSSNGPGIINKANGYENLHREIFQILTGLNVTIKTLGKNDVPSKEDARREWQKQVRQKFLNMTLEGQKKLQLENVTGLFGNPQSGDFMVTIENGTGNDEDRLYFRSGEWSTGFLIPLPDSNTTFSLAWDSDIVQEMYAASQGGEIEELLLDFSDVNKPLMLTHGMTMTFERDLTIDKLPNQAWDKNSCGPYSPNGQVQSTIIRKSANKTESTKVTEAYLF